MYPYATKEHANHQVCRAPKTKRTNRYDTSSVIRRKRELNRLKVFVPTLAVFLIDVFCFYALNVADADSKYLLMAAFYTTMGFNINTYFRSIYAES